MFCLCVRMQYSAGFVMEAGRVCKNLILQVVFIDLSIVFAIQIDVQTQVLFP
jgi:hypothetical protein